MSSKKKPDRKTVVKQLTPIVMQNLVKEIRHFAEGVTDGDLELANTIYLTAFAKMLQGYKEARRKHLIEKTARSVGQSKAVSLPN